MATPTIEKIAKSNADASTKSGEAAETIMKSSTEAPTESGAASRAAVQELTKAYQDLATKNAKNLTAAIQGLSAVKNPVEFMQLQQKLIKEGVEAAVSDSHHIAQLTTAVFTAAFEPVKKQIEAVQKTRTHLGLESHEVVFGFGRGGPMVRHDPLRLIAMPRQGGVRVSSQRRPFGRTKPIELETTQPVRGAPLGAKWL